MTAVSDRYRQLAGQFGETAAAVPDDKWSAPSPCEGWAARDVVRHVVGNAGWFLGFIGGNLDGAPSVDDDPVAAFTSAREAIQKALDDSATAGTTVDAFGGPMK